MLAKMSFLWSDSTSPPSKTSGRDKEKLKEAVVQSKDIDKGSLKSLKQVEMVNKLQIVCSFLHLKLSCF